MSLYNLNLLERIRIIESHTPLFISWKKERKFFGITFRKEGYYAWPRDQYIGTQLPESLILVDEKAMTKPCVELRFTNCTFEKEFDTLEAAQKFKKVVESKQGSLVDLNNLE